ncbi:MAG: hypothetical protein SVT56_00625 [Chloroflexota bacterium]|jgi:hypothetical protein|nr:hypothetical protein [Chloroflexota bacterium]
MMKSNDGKSWGLFLERWGLKSWACEMMDHAASLFPFTAQVMVLGLPLFKDSPFGAQYQGLIDMLGDEDHVALFSKYLQGGGV